MDSVIEIRKPLDGYKCDTYYWEESIWYHPIITMIIVFIISFILSYFSLGFFFFLIIYILSEFTFAYKLGFMYTLDILIIRSSIFLVGLFGFITGRLYLNNDINPFRHSYHDFL
jgi:hypothetical protein